MFITEFTKHQKITYNISRITYYIYSIFTVLTIRPLNFEIWRHILLSTVLGCFTNYLLILGTFIFNFCVHKSTFSCANFPKGFYWYWTWTSCKTNYYQIEYYKINFMFFFKKKKCLNRHVIKSLMFFTVYKF